MKENTKTGVLLLTQFLRVTSRTTELLPELCDNVKRVIIACAQF